MGFLTMKLKLSFVLVAILIGAAMLPFYFVRNSSGGIALQKGEDVYLFLGAGREGYRSVLLDTSLANQGLF